MTFDLPPPLDDLVPRVSRSFALSLNVLPRALRRSFALAYLLARTADTIADTTAFPAGERLEWLSRFAAQLDRSDGGAAAIVAAVAANQAVSERTLLRELPACLDVLGGLPAPDGARIRRLLHILVTGMRRDLERFPAGRLTALASRADLDEYTYYAAGCVGEFWTEMLVAHCPSLVDWDLPAMTALGRRFGQGLQMTNVLRDLPADLRLGRCYLPRDDLARHELAPEDLLGPEGRDRLPPLLAELIAVARTQHACGWRYLSALPPSEARLRLACAWPLFIGLKTLARLQATPNLLATGPPVKISRGAVYRLLALSTALVRWDGALERYYRHLDARLGTATAPAHKETA